MASTSVTRTPAYWRNAGSLPALARHRQPAHPRTLPARKEEVILLQTSTDALRRLFKSDLPGMQPLRNLGMNLTNRLPLIKNMLTRYALGTL